MQLNLDASRVVQFVDTLERMKKSALPRAVKETLSKTALDVKQRSMPKSAQKAFTIRRSNFFKANSSVDFAKGSNIATMKSTVGFIEGKLQGDKNFAVKDLEQQEYGGRIKGRKFIPMDTARVGKSREKSVKRSVPKLKELKSLGIIWANDRVQGGRRRAKTKKQRWVRAAFRAGVGGFVAGNMKQGRVTVRRIDSISSSISTRQLQIKSTPVYSYKKGGIRPVKSRGFMRRATMDSGSTVMNDIFINEARKQIEYLMNR